VHIFIVNFLELKEKVLFNTTRRGVGITHMEEVFILEEYVVWKLQNIDIPFCMESHSLICFI
jgi:hypothetical protein